MRKLFRSINTFFVIAIIAMATAMGQASGQAVKNLSAPVPDDVSKIFQNSCMPCHGSNGGLMAKTKLDFLKWTEYDTKKAAEKASKICALITDGSMPPKSIRQSKPEIVPTKDQIAFVCKWAGSLKPKEAR